MAPAISPAALAGWLILGALASALITALALGYARRAALLDHPGRRRSHSVATPRGGGVGPVAAWLLLLVALQLAGAAPAHATALAIGTLLVAGVGALDDHRALSAWPRLLVHLLAAALLVVSLRGVPATPTAALASLALVVALAALVNFWNFMDGIDGLAAMQTAFVATALAMAATWSGRGGVAVLAALLAAAVAGFLPFNAPRARIFLGDVGSGALGFACGGLLLLAWHARALDAATALLLPSVFVLDAGLTLAHRFVAGRRWYTAHREHLYQWLVRRGLAHARVVALYLAWNLLIVTPLSIAVLLHRAPPTLALAVALAAGAAVWLAGRRLLLRRARRYGATP